jgi:hypothetical protein
MSKRKRSDPIDSLTKLINLHPAASSDVVITAERSLEGDWTLHISGNVPDWVVVTCAVLTLPPSGTKTLILNGKKLDLTEGSGLS